MRNAVVAYLLAILVIGGLVTAVMTRETETEKAESEAHAEETEKKPAALPAGITPGPEIAERVEQIRGQAFGDKAPVVQVVPEAELEKQLAELDSEPTDDPDRDAAAALLLAQAGALPAQEAQALAIRRYGGTGVLGSYVRKGRAVLISEEFAEKEPEVAELVAAQELSRALDVGPSEDAERVAPPFADERAALVALRAGVAAQVEREYATEHLGREASGDSEVEISRGSRDDPATPPLVQTLATLPSEAGRRYVARLHESGGWDAVDEILGEPPTTTAAILHPDAPDDQAEAAPTFAVRPVLRDDWEKLASADVGELDTIGLLRAGLGEEPARKAAAGWRSGRFETWVKGGRQAAESCPPPCRDKSASIVVWRFADAAASLAFVRAMREAVIESAAARPEGGRGLVIDGAGAALVRAGRFAALSFAPDAVIAGDLAKTALEP